MPPEIQGPAVDLMKLLGWGDDAEPTGEGRSAEATSDSGSGDGSASAFVSILDDLNKKVRNIIDSSGPVSNPLFGAKPTFDTTRLMNDGYSYLSDGKFEDAAEAFEGIRAITGGDAGLDEYLGEAYFGAGDYKKTREAYRSALEVSPHNTNVLKLHMEASQKYLGTFDHVRYDVEAKQVQQEIVADRALIVAVDSEKEIEGLDELGTELGKVNFKSPEEAKQAIDKVQVLAQNYLALSSVPFADSQEAEFVQGRLSILAGQAFQIAGALSSNSSYEDIKKLTPLYQGYFYLTEGNSDAAMEEFAKVRKEAPEADQIMSRVEGDKLKSINVMALDAWETFVSEDVKKALDGARSFEGAFDGAVNELLGGGRTAVSTVHDTATIERKVIGRARDLITEGKCSTIREALAVIQDEDDSGVILRPSIRAKQILEDLKYNDGDHRGGLTLRHLIQYSAVLKPDEKIAGLILEDADQISARQNYDQTSFALSVLVKGTSANSHNKEGAARQIKSLKEGKGTLDAIWDTVRTAGTDDILSVGAQIAAFAVSGGVGALAKLATLDRLAAAGISGTKAILIAGGVGVVAEGSTLWGLNTIQDAFKHDAEQVFSVEHLAKSYGATLAMFPFIKVFSAAGTSAGIKGARALGWVAEGGSTLSGLGKAFASGATHIGGASGMIASSLFSQSTGLAPITPGGLGGTIVHEIFGYAKYAVAGGAFHNVLGADFAAAHDALHSEIALKEAALTVEGNLKTLGFAATSREDGSPVYESPEARTLYGQMVILSLTCPGFSSETVANLIKDGKSSEATDYLRGFGLKATMKGRKLTGFEELSAHEEIGIAPAAPKAAEEPNALPDAARRAESARIIDPEATGAGSPQALKGRKSISSVEVTRKVSRLLHSLKLYENQQILKARQRHENAPIEISEVGDPSTQDVQKINVSVDGAASKEAVLKIVRDNGMQYDPARQTVRTAEGCEIPLTISVDHPNTEAEGKSTASVLPPGALYSVAGAPALFASLAGTVGTGAAAAITGALTVVGILGMVWGKGRSTPAAGTESSSPALPLRPYADGRDSIVGREGGQFVFDPKTPSSIDFTISWINDGSNPAGWYLIKGSRGDASVGPADLSLNGEGMNPQRKAFPIKQGDKISTGGKTFVFQDPARSSSFAAAAKGYNTPLARTKQRAIELLGQAQKDRNVDFTRTSPATLSDGRVLTVEANGQEGVFIAVVEYALSQGESPDSAFAMATHAVRSINSSFRVGKISLGLPGAH